MWRLQQQAPFYICILNIYGEIYKNKRKKVIKMKSRKISAEILQYIETNLTEQLSVNPVKALQEFPMPTLLSI